MKSASYAIRVVCMSLLLAALGGCTGTQMLNALAVGGEVEAARNLVYDTEHNGRLDVYSPKGVANAPVIVFFHGGRWQSESKEEFEYVGMALAQQGYVAVIPEVRKYPQTRFAGFMEDAAQAVKWTRENAQQYQGSPRRLFLMGHSSGAHIAAMLALDEDYLKNIEGSREWIRGVIGLAGPYDFMPITAPDLREIFGPPEDFEKSQPVYFADGRNPPLLLIHGENDETVGVKNTRSLAHAVKTANGPVETIVYTTLSHDMVLRVLAPTLQGRADVMSGIIDFIRRTLENPVAPGGISGEAFIDEPEEPQGTPLPAEERSVEAPTSGFEPVPLTPVEEPQFLEPK